MADFEGEAASDPFAHLHDEDYASTYAALVDWRDTVFMGGRAVEPLDGPWRFVLDLYDEGLRQRWFADDPSPSETWSVPRDYDGGDWQTVPVPSSWNVLRPKWTYFEGSAWYTRDIAPVLALGERLVLRVGAANYRARVFLNGSFLGGHRGGSTPFFVELGPHLRAGANRLQIMVENRRAPDRVPMTHFDWFNYGGLHREVAIVRLPSVFVRAFEIALEPDGSFSRLRVRVALSEPVDTVARLVIDGLGAWLIAVEAGEGHALIDAEPEPWSPDRPHLYACQLTVLDDTVSDRVGLREIRVEGRSVLLNGVPIWLKGVCCHEDDVALGRVSNDHDIRRRLTHARELGANAIRLAHYPHHERVAELADEMGVLLIAEIPVYWAIAFDNPETLSDAQTQLSELIRRDYNRASVIAWSIGNENADTDARLAFLTDLAGTARALDPSRLVTAACLIDRKTFSIADRLTAVVDVIGLNEYFGWYEPDFDGLVRLLGNSTPDKPVVISETGADASTGFGGERGRLFSEAHQAYVHARQLEIVRSVPYIAGYFPWLLYDFRSERRQTERQRGFNLKGLIDRNKTDKKAAFHTIAEAYRNLR